MKLKLLVLFTSANLLFSACVTENTDIPLNRMMSGDVDVTDQMDSLDHSVDTGFSSGDQTLDLAGNRFTDLSVDQGYDETLVGTCIEPYTFVEVDNMWLSEGSAHPEISICSVPNESLGIVSVFEAPQTGTYQFYTEKSIGSFSLSLRTVCDQINRQTRCHTSEPSLWFNGSYASIMHSMIEGERVYLLMSKEASLMSNEPVPRFTMMARLQDRENIPITYTAARLEQETIQIALSAETGIRALSKLSVRLTAASGESLLKTFKPWQLTQVHTQEGRFSSKLNITPIAPLTVSSDLTIELKLFDQDQRESGWTRVEFINPEILPRGSLCEMDDLFSLCHPDDLCLFVQRESLCVERSPWQAHQLQAFFQPELNRFGVKLLVENRSNHKPQELVMNFYDHQGQPIITDIREHHFAQLIATEDKVSFEYSGAWINATGTLGQQAAHLQEIEVGVIGSQGQRSNLLRSFVREPLMVTEGDNCDVTETLNVCPPGYTCHDICLPTDQDLSECSPEINLIQFTGEMGSIEGNLSTSTIAGSWCYTQGYNHYYQFTAPRESFYSFNVRSSAFDPVISLTTECHSSPMNSMCDDDSYYGDDPVINTRLEAGESIYLRVGAYGNTGFGEYTINYLPCHIEDLGCY